MCTFMWRPEGQRTLLGVIPQQSSTFEKTIYIFLIMYMGEEICAHECSVYRSQKRASGLLELELQTVGGHLICMLGTEPES